MPIKITQSTNFETYSTNFRSPTMISQVITGRRKTGKKVL